MEMNFKDVPVNGLFISDGDVYQKTAFDQYPGTGVWRTDALRFKDNHRFIISDDALVDHFVPDDIVFVTEEPTVKLDPKNIKETNTRTMVGTFIDTIGDIHNNTSGVWRGSTPINNVYGMTADKPAVNRGYVCDPFDITYGVWAGRIMIPHIIAGMDRADDFDGDTIASVPIDWSQKSDSNNVHGMTADKPAEPTPYDRHLSELETGDMFIMEGDKDYVYEMLGRNGLATLLGYDAGKLYIKKIFNGEVQRIPGDTKVFFLRKSNPAANPASTRLTPIHAKALKIGTQFMMSGASNDNIYEIVPDPDVFGTAKKREHVRIMNLNTGMLLHCALDLWVYRMDEPTKAVEPTPYDTALSTLNVGDYFEMQGDTDMYSVNDSCEVFPSAVIVKVKMLNVFNITKQMHMHVSPDTMVCFVRADKPAASINSANPTETLLSNLKVGDQFVSRLGFRMKDSYIYEVVPNTTDNAKNRIKVFGFSKNKITYEHPDLRVHVLQVEDVTETKEPLGTLTFYDGHSESVKFCRAMGCGLIMVGTDSEVYMYNTFARKLFCSPDDILIDTDHDGYQTRSTLSLSMDSVNNFKGWQMTNDLYKKLENELKKYS